MIIEAKTKYINIIINPEEISWAEEYVDNINDYVEQKNNNTLIKMKDGKQFVITESIFDFYLRCNNDIQRDQQEIQ